MAVYKGWWVLLGLMLVYFGSNGLLTNSLQLFYPVFTEEFGWDTETVTRPASVMFFLGAITSPFAGILLDRYSTRHIMLIGLIAISIGLFFLSRMQNQTQMLIIYAVFACGLSLGGMASNMLVLSRWFKAKIGLAAGLLLMSSSLGGAVLPKILNYTIEQYDWRQAMLVASVLGGLLMIVPLIILVRNSPADFGLKIDGGVAGSDNLSALEENQNIGLTVLEALRQPRFYLLAVVTATLWFVIVPLLQHQSLYIKQDLTYSGNELANFFSFMFASSVIGKLSFGWLSDFIDKHWSLIVSTMLFALGVFGLSRLQPDQAINMYICATATGLGFAGVFSNIQILFANYYAGKNYGKILTIFVMLDSLAGAAGIWIIARMRDSSGSYESPLHLMLILLIISMLITMLLFWMSKLSTKKIQELKI